jgi:hypothetical protein
VKNKKIEKIRRTGDQVNMPGTLALPLLELRSTASSPPIK